MRLMQRKISDLRSAAATFLKDPLWEDAPRSQAEGLQQMDKQTLVALMATGQTAVEQARERRQEATWVRLLGLPRSLRCLGSRCQCDRRPAQGREFARKQQTMWREASAAGQLGRSSGWGWHGWLLAFSHSVLQALPLAMCPLAPDRPGTLGCMRAVLSCRWGAPYERERTREYLP